MAVPEDRTTGANSCVRSLVFLAMALVCLASLVVAPGRAWSGSASNDGAVSNTSSASSASAAPALLTQANPARGIALDSVTQLTEPFSLTEPNAFGGDGRTRVMLFATNLTLAA